MKRKNGRVLVSLLLSGMIALNMFPMFDRHTAAADTDQPTEKTAVSDVRPSDASAKETSGEKSPAEQEKPAEEEQKPAE